MKLQSGTRAELSESVVESLKHFFWALLWARFFSRPKEDIEGKDAHMSHDITGPKLFFVTGLVIFVTTVARLVCPDLLG